MVHPAMARGGGGRCGETCAGLFTGIAGIAVLFALQRIPVILKHSLRERNSWRIRLGLVVG
jgi:hypothetical protein